MAKASKGPRILVRLNCTEGSGHFYTTTTNTRNNEAKLEIRKYNPVLRKHILYKEGKIK